MSGPAASLAELEHVLDECAADQGPVRPLLAVAVSGGVDSMTLASAAHARLRDRARMFHATSPAVPPAATARVRALAGSQGWQLAVIDAGELDDPDYRANPADRCLFCKRSLYGAIQSASDVPLQLLAGTNLDDLGDFRPGLRAADEAGVRHPFVEARMTKSDVRALARHLGLGELAELPAAPCLASRIETGLTIDPDQLRRIDQVELEARATLAAAGVTATHVRCRVRADGIELALDDAALQALRQPSAGELAGRLIEQARLGWGGEASRDAPRLEPYRMGSTFLADDATRARHTRAGSTPAPDPQRTRTASPEPTP